MTTGTLQEDETLPEEKKRKKEEALSGGRGPAAFQAAQVPRKGLNSPEAVLALQRLAGNRAVATHLSAQNGDELDGGGEVDDVQATTEHANATSSGIAPANFTWGDAIAPWNRKKRIKRQQRENNDRYAGEVNMPGANWAWGDLATPWNIGARRRQELQENRSAYNQTLDAVQKAHMEFKQSAEQPTFDVAERAVPKKGKAGKDEIKDDPSAYRKASFNAVKRAGTAYLHSQEHLSLLNADMEAVAGANELFLKLDDPAKKDRLIKALNEKSPPEALKNALNRVDKATNNHDTIVQERAMVEHHYDLVQAKHNEVKQRRLSARIDRRKGGTPEQLTNFVALAVGDMKRNTQEALASLDVVEVKSAQNELLRVYVQKELKRLPGTGKKVGSGVVSGLLGVIVQALTLGIVSAGVNKDKRGYVKGNALGAMHMGGSPMPKGGSPVRLAFLNDIVMRVKQLKQEFNMRRGRYIWDQMSAVLGGVNEIILQNIINIAGWMGTWLSLIGIVLTLAGATAYGAGAAIGVVITWIGFALAALGVVSALAKASINNFRAAAAWLSALWNQDAKVQNELNARMTGATMDAVSSNIQLAGKTGGFVGDFSGVGVVTNTATHWVGEGFSYAGTGGGVGASLSPVIGDVASPNLAKHHGDENFNAPASLRERIPTPASGNKGSDPEPAQAKSGSAQSNLNAAMDAEQVQRKAARDSRTQDAQGKALHVNSRVKEIRMHIGSIFAPLAKMGGWFKKDPSKKEAKALAKEQKQEAKRAAKEAKRMAKTNKGAPIPVQETPTAPPASVNEPEEVLSLKEGEAETKGLSAVLSASTEVLNEVEKMDPKAITSSMGV